jgi:DUF4097 and DUF4098 domain-containing protein YvlB
MESRSRNLWIIGFVIVAILCLCALVVAVAGVSWIRDLSSDGGGEIGRNSERIEQAFEVGESPGLTIDNFTGDITIRAGEAGIIEVVAVKKASSSGNLERIDLEMTERDGGLIIETRKPSALSRASVDFEITTPADTRLDLRVGTGDVDVGGLTGGAAVDTGTGDVELRNLAGGVEVDIGTGDATLMGVDGEANVHSGTGNMSVLGASGPARLDVGTGDIDYEGAPEGDCRFETGTGDIRLKLPADLNVRVDLEVGTGSIDVGYDVEGDVSRRDVRGTIGSGQEGTISAETGTGDIDLVRR